MIITRKNLSRRTVLRGSRGDRGVAAARRDGSGLDGRGPDSRERAATHGGRLHAERHDDERLDAGR